MASRYPNQREPLWNLPGGRQRDEELLAGTLTREFREETGLTVVARELAYLGESYDPRGGVHVLSAVFVVEGDGDPACGADAHVVDVAWCPRGAVASRIAVAVVRDPLVAFLDGWNGGYHAVADAGITIEFADEA